MKIGVKHIRVVLVDDHAVVREGYRTLLQKHADLMVVGEAADAALAYQSYKELRPDVVVMDISMPGRGGIDAVIRLRQIDADANVLIFTMHCGAIHALQAFRAGARGYITKSSSPELLVSAVREVESGRIAICPEISEVLALDRIDGDRSRLSDLSPREFEVLRMLLEARSADEISSSLNVSRKTVGNYHYTIKSKLMVSSDIELIYFALRNGLIAPVTYPSWHERRPSPCR